MESRWSIPKRVHPFASFGFDIFGDDRKLLGFREPGAAVQVIGSVSEVGGPGGVAVCRLTNSKPLDEGCAGDHEAVFGYLPSRSVA